MRRRSCRGRSADGFASLRPAPDTTSRAQGHGRPACLRSPRAPRTRARRGSRRQIAQQTDHTPTTPTRARAAIAPRRSDRRASTLRDGRVPPRRRRRPAAPCRADWRGRRAVGAVACLRPRAPRRRPPRGRRDTCRPLAPARLPIRRGTPRDRALHGPRRARSFRHRRMQRDDAARKQAVAHIVEAGGGDVSGERFGSGKAAYARGQIRVCGTSRQHLAEHWYDAVEPEAVEGCEHTSWARDLEDAEPAPGTKHAAQFRQRALEARDVSDAEADRRCVEAAVGERQLEQVAADPLDLGRLATSALEEPCQRLVTRESRIAVQLGREHLDAGARGADAELDVYPRKHFDETGRVGRARGARYAEEDAHRPPTWGPWMHSGTRRAASAGPSRARRTSA